jgi:hypothetical protein
MRNRGTAIPIGIVSLAAALLLSACGSSRDASR